MAGYRPRARFPLRGRTPRRVPPRAQRRRLRRGIPVPTLTINDLTSATTLDNVALAQTHILAVDDLTSATTLSAIGSMSPTPYPVGVSTSNYLVDQNGDPWKGAVFSSWAMAMRLSEADITWAVESLHDRGFRGVNFAFCGGLDFGSEWAAVQYEDRDGNSFFTGTPFRSDLGPGFDRTDFIVSECERLGMICVMSFFCSFGTSGCIAEIAAATNAEMELFGQRVGTRYASSPNLVWEIMEDSGDVGSIRSKLDYFAKGLDSTRTSYPNLWFVEPGLGGDAFGYISAEGTEPTGWEWLHMCSNSLYSYDNDHANDAEGVWSDAVAFGTRDIAAWDCEPPYGHNTHYDDGIGGESQGLRMRNITVFLEGFSMINYGDEPWWTFDFSGSGSTAYLDVPDNSYTVQASYIWDIVDQYINGNSTWVPTSWIVTGESTGDTKAAAGHSDTAAIAMFPTSRTIVVDTTVIAGTGPVRIRWYDPSAGTYTTVSSSTAQSASQSVTHPGNNSDGETDWLLIVDEPPVALSIADLTSASTLDNQTLTQTHVLTVGNLTSAATLDNVALGVDLVIANLTSASTVDNLALSQVHVLAVQNLTSATALDNVVLNFGASLVIGDLVSAATLDNLALTQVHSLVVQDLASAATLDNLALTQTHVLAIADLTSASTLDNQTLTQLHILVIQDMVSGEALDNVDLTVEGTLTIQDLVSGGLLEDLTLETSISLVIADLTSAGTLDNLVLVTGANLVIADLVSISTLDGLALGQIHELNVNDMRSFTNLSNLTFVAGTIVGKMRGEWVL